ncbi:MAG: LysR family transcriptional regulator [Sphingomonadaceae bacterium]|nr:LysR family transcriptional regulator [Sphingomonadaceae bacterium]
MSDLDRLIRFSVVAEELSFSQAARRLNVDQPWLSRQIQQLEAQLGFALFVRSTRKVSLTKQGEALFAHASRLADAAHECQLARRELVRAHSRTLAIGVNPYSFWLPERRRLIECFQSTHPQVTISFVSDHSANLMSRLRQGLIDVALLAEPFDFADTEALIMHESPIALLVPPDDPLADQRRVPITDLAGRCIPMTPQKTNPACWNVIYKPFLDAGAIPWIVAEGEPAIAFVAREKRLPVICVGWPHSEFGALTGFTHVAIEDAPIHRFALVRRREPSRGLLRNFWNTACRLLDGDAPHPIADGFDEETLRPTELA